MVKTSMRFSTCSKCHVHLQNQLQDRLTHLRFLRYGHPRLFHSSVQNSLGSSPNLTKGKEQKRIQSLYVDTFAPTSVQLDASTTFFLSHRPTKSWTATEWRKHNPHSDTTDLTPEIVFLGRSNSGKSSLLNALLQDAQLCRVGAKPGKTTTMHAWDLTWTGPVDESGSLRQKRKQKRLMNDTKPVLTVLDMPGYGFGSHSEWGKDILKYLTRRRQLRRAFVLINPSHGLKTSDYQTLELLRTEGISHQIIACKCDQLHPQTPDSVLAYLSQLQTEVSKHFGVEGAGRKSLGGGIGLLTLNDILAVGSLGDGRMNNTIDQKRMFGVDEVRWAVLRAAGLDEYAVSATSPTESSTNEAPQEFQQPTQSGMVTSKPFSTLNEMPAQDLNHSSPATKSPSIGIGIEELLAMTETERPKPKPRLTSKSASQPKPKGKAMLSRLRRR